MSSAEEEYNDGDNSSTLAPESKKRRVQRACDTCRRKKIRCDGSQMPGNRCSNCITYNFECTYIEAAKKRGPPKGYVENLENRLEKMEKLLQKVCPDADFSRELGGPRIDRESWQRGTTSASTSGHIINAAPPSYSKPHPDIDELVPSDDEDIAVRLSESFRSVSLNPLQTRFFGKSSGVKLIQKAMDLKKEVTGNEPTPHFFLKHDECFFPWELAARNIKVPEYIFPEEDLGESLVNLYFTKVNILLPLLHRPSFERKIQQGVHLRDSTFGSVYLLVCAIGARFTDDTRVCLDDVQPPQREQSSGWKYFQQVQMVRRALLGTPCLEDLQIYSLSVLFLHGSSAPQACWTIAGVGIRLAQDVGAHRRKSYFGKPSVEGELWKRAFWVLVMLDRQMSSSLGRPCAIQDEDFDLEFPIECDDEYWEHPDPEQAFKQPPGKPSTISFFILYLKLSNIMSFALRTIYSINKSKILLGFVGQQWEQHIVAELDSSLNKWIDEVPDHLRWDPTRDVNSPFFMQSSALYAYYYVIQIFVHRPFIPSPRKPSPLSFPSLAICTNAARSCSHIMDIYRKRSGSTAYFLQMSAFTAGIVLLLNIWGGKRSGLSTDPLKEMADVHKCMAILKSCENRWHTSGRLWDILYELASVGDLPLPQHSPQGTKRERDPDSPTLESRPSSNPREATRTIAGTRRVDVQPQPHHPLPQQSTLQPPDLRTYDLPVYSNDLGRFPVHGQVNFPMKGSTPATSSSTSPSTSSAVDSPPSLWFPPLSDGAHRQRPPSHPSPLSTHDFASSNPFSIDELFYDQMTAPFGGFPTAGHGTSTSAGQSHTTTHDDLQAFVDATVAGRVQSSMLPGSGPNGILDVDIDTMAMWSSAPAGFGVNDWGAYLSNVVHHPDGSSTTSHTRHGQGHGS